MSKLGATRSRKFFEALSRKTLWFSWGKIWRSCLGRDGEKFNLGKSGLYTRLVPRRFPIPVTDQESNTPMNRMGNRLSDDNDNDTPLCARRETTHQGTGSCLKWITTLLRSPGFSMGRQCDLLNLGKSTSEAPHPKEWIPFSSVGVCRIRQTAPWSRSPQSGGMTRLPH